MNYFKNCKLCNHSESSYLGEFLDSNDKSVEIFSCSNCFSLNPIYPEKYPSTSLQVDFHESWWKNSSIEEMLQVRNDLLSVVVNLESYLGEKSNNCTIAEIGCGRGSLLAALKEKGYNAIGCEPSIELVNLARNIYKLNDDVLYNEDVISFLKNQKEKFNAIILWHVLEHIESPLSILEKTVELLNDDGRIILQLPLLDKKYIYPEHYFFVTHETFEIIAKQLGVFLERVDYDNDHMFVTAIFSKSNRSFIINKFMGFDVCPGIIDQSLLLRDGSINNLKNILMEKDRGMKLMDEMIVNRDIEIKAINDLIQEKIHAMDTMESMIIDRNKEIVAINKIIEDRGKEIVAINKTIEDREKEIDAINISSEKKDQINNDLNKKIELYNNNVFFKVIKKLNLIN